jgi:hypothetical protein
MEHKKTRICIKNLKAEKDLAIVDAANQWSNKLA